LAILDFSKAFDRLPHQRLLRKIEHYGIRGMTYAWIADFLHNRKQQVVVDGATVPVISGVPQGSVFGPLLFLLFINDIPSEVNSSTRLVADDCILYRAIKSSYDCSILQDDLESLTNWEERWGMDFHPDKCCTLRMPRSRSPIINQYSLKGHILKNEDWATYLGVDIQASWMCNTHINRSVKKANSMLGFLRRNFKIQDQQTKSSAYFSLVRPSLEYCCTVWSPYTKISITK
jgi:ribonuclease P/MRP protein subunit RPP40